MCDVTRHSELPHIDVPNLFEISATLAHHVVVNVLHELFFLISRAFLYCNNDHVVFHVIRNQIWQMWGLWLSRHIPTHNQNLNLLGKGQWNWAQSAQISMLSNRLNCVWLFS
jgi:hypothetical protein